MIHARKTHRSKLLFLLNIKEGWGRKRKINKKKRGGGSNLRMMVCFMSLRTSLDTEDLSA